MLAQSARSAPQTHDSASAAVLPQMSIVLVVSPTTPSPAARLSAAVATCREHGAELLVAWNGTRTQLRSLENAFPSVRFVTADAEQGGVRALRAQACAQATGDLVSMVPESQPLDESWFVRRFGGAVAAWREGDSA